MFFVFKKFKFRSLSFLNLFVEFYFMVMFYYTVRSYFYVILYRKVLGLPSTRLPRTHWICGVKKQKRIRQVRTCVQLLYAHIVLVVFFFVIVFFYSLRVTWKSPMIFIDFNFHSKYYFLHYFSFTFFYFINYTFILEKDTTH